MTTTAYREQSQSEAESAQVPSLVQLLCTSLIGHDHLKKDWKKTGRYQYKMPLLILLEPKLHVKSLRQTL